MKKLIIILAAGLISFACSENSRLVDPVQMNSAGNLPAARSEGGNFSWISQPTSKTDKFIDLEQIEAEKNVDLKKGGKITASWKKKGGREVNAELIVPKGANNDLKSLNFYMLIDSDNLTIKFEPHPIYFDIPLTLSLEFKGLDLKGIKASEIYFAYLDDPSSGFVVSSEQIDVDIKKGTISISNVKIDHFSQYGFVRKDSPVGED